MPLSTDGCVGGNGEDAEQEICCGSEMQDFEG